MHLARLRDLVYCEQIRLPPIPLRMLGRDKRLGPQYLVGGISILDTSYR